MNSEKVRIGFIGSGNIAQALAKGFINSKIFKPEQISATAPTDKNLAFFKALKCHTSHSNEDIFSNCLTECGDKLYVLFLCVKPMIFKKDEKFMNFLACDQLFNLTQSSKLIVVSVLAGVKLISIIERFPIALKYTIPLARIMPNTACSINYGSIGLCYHNNLIPIPDQRKDLFKLFTILGLCEIVNEDQMDAVCGVAGSGIAFAYSMIQSMADGAVLAGLSRSTALNLSAQTLLGACKMVQETGKNPIELRDQVCSPSGTTINGLLSLETGNFNATVMSAVKSAASKSKDFSSMMSDSSTL